MKIIDNDKTIELVVDISFIKDAVLRHLLYHAQQAQEWTTKERCKLIDSSWKLVEIDQEQGGSIKIELAKPESR